MGKFKKFGLIILLILFSFSCFAYRPGDKVVLISSKNCPACTEAKNMLKSKGIPFMEKMDNKAWIVPQLFVNGKYRGTGTGAVWGYINE